MRVILCVLCTLLVCTVAQEGASSCASEVSAAVETVNAQLRALTSEKDAVSADAKACKDSYAKLYASWQQQDGEITKLKGTVTDLNAEVTSLEVKLQKASVPPKLDAADVAVALVSIAKEHAQAAAKTAQEIFQDLRQGKTDKLSALLVSISSTLRGAASSTYAFIKAELQEHTPEPVKQKVAEVADKAHTVWRQQVLEAEWAQPMLRQLKTVNDDVKALVTKAMESSPALKPMADPVMIQLVVYAVFALPLLVLLVLPLALLGDGKKKASDVRPNSQVKGKKKAAKRA